MKLPEKWQKLWNKMVNTLFNKVLGENEKCVFTLKPKELFGQPTMCGKGIPCSKPCFGNITLATIEPDRRRSIINMTGDLLLTNKIQQR